MGQNSPERSTGRVRLLLKVQKYFSREGGRAVNPGSSVPIAPISWYLSKISYRYLYRLIVICIRFHIGKRIINLLRFRLTRRSPEECNYLRSRARCIRRECCRRSSCSYSLFYSPCNGFCKVIAILNIGEFGFIIRSIAGLADIGILSVRRGGVSGIAAARIAGTATSATRTAGSTNAG